MMKPIRAAAGALLAAAGLLAGGSARAQQSSLSVDYANAGVSSPDVATCLQGSYLGGDTRWCSGSIPSTTAKAGDTLFGWGWATYGNGLSTQAWGRAAFGTLGAYAQSDVPTSVNDFHNTQSRGASSLSDVILASNASGAPTETYQYTIVIHGSLSAPVGVFGVFPYGFAYVSTGFSTSPINCPGCSSGVIANWTAQSGQTSSTVLQGSFSVPIGVIFQVRASLDTNSYLNTFANQSAFAEANYDGGMHVYIDALTPGANTVGASGFNYASAVPEPAVPALMLAGLLALALRRRGVAAR